MAGKDVRMYQTGWVNLLVIKEGWTKWTCFGWINNNFLREKNKENIVIIQFCLPLSFILLGLCIRRINNTSLFHISSYDIVRKSIQIIVIMFKYGQGLLI